jgi:hypothetical protein
MKLLKHPGGFRNIALALLAALLAAGCASTNTIAARRQAHADGYAILAPDMKAAVDQGQIKVGMSKDGVLIAWGKANQIIHAGNAGGETTTWIYQGLYTQETQFWGGYRLHYAYTPMTYVRAQVVFVNDVVQSWQTFPAPLN